MRWRRSSFQAPIHSSHFPHSANACSSLNRMHHALLTNTSLVPNVLPTLQSLHTRSYHKPTFYQHSPRLNNDGVRPPLLLTHLPTNPSRPDMHPSGKRWLAAYIVPGLLVVAALLVFIYFWIWLSCDMRKGRKDQVEMQTGKSA